MYIKQVLHLALIIIVSVTISVDLFAADNAQRDELNPRGRIHIPIGLANSLDTLKTFVEAEGNFSPGVGSYGIYFWLFDKNTGKLIAPTMEGVKCEHGLAEGRYLIPWSEWSAEKITVKTEVCEVRRRSPKGQVYIVGSRVKVDNADDEIKELALG